MKQLLLPFLFVLLVKSASAQTPEIAEAHRRGAEPHLLSRPDQLGLPDMTFERAVLIDSNRILVHRFTNGGSVIDTLVIPESVPLERSALDSLLHYNYGGFHPLLSDSPLLKTFGLISTIPWPVGVLLLLLGLWWRKR